MKRRVLDQLPQGKLVGGQFLGSICLRDESRDATFAI
jgi:hypothetical protein